MLTTSFIVLFRRVSKRQADTTALKNGRNVGRSSVRISLLRLATSLGIPNGGRTDTFLFQVAERLVAAKGRLDLDGSRRFLSFLKEIVRYRIRPFGWRAAYLNNSIATTDSNGWQDHAIDED